MPTLPAAQRYAVAISGASFAGLALACGLARALGPDCRIALIDRDAGAGSAAPRDSRASALAAGSRHMLEALGIWPAVAEEAQPVASIDITDSSLDAGVRPVLLTYDNVTKAGEPATYILPNGVLHAALEAAVRRIPSVTWIVPDEVQSFAADDTEVRVRLASGGELTAARFGRHQGRGLELSADRHRHDRAPRAPA
jgi:2-octaprenyl-6-methoxyphenol hydroxylase